MIRFTSFYTQLNTNSCFQATEIYDRLNDVHKQRQMGQHKGKNKPKF